MATDVCPGCGRDAEFERRSVPVWAGEVPVGNALVLTCAECDRLQAVLDSPADG